MADTQNDREHPSQFYLKNAYYEDEFIYPQYFAAEAELIIVPSEDLNEEKENISELPLSEDISAKGTKEKLTLKTTAKALALKGYDFVFIVGDETIRFLGNLIKKTGPFLLIPFAVISTLFSALKNKIKASLRHKPKLFGGEFEEILKQQTEGEKVSKKEYLKAFLTYLVRGNRLLKACFNLAFPLAAVLIVMSVYGNLSDTVFALEVIYNGQSIGYIEAEEVFNEGKSQALALISTSVKDTDDTSTLVSAPVYKVRRVPINELSNSGMVSESIIACSDVNYVRACGIYIDGEFLCAVKNESDAVTVFNNLLEPYEKEVDASATVAFVEEIEYVQGLFPEDSDVIWDSMKLSKTLSKPKTEAETHKFKKGDTVKSVAKQYGLTVAQLKALNPDVNFKNTDEIKSLLVARQTNYVRVKVMRTRTRTESIPYETIKKNSSTLAKGTSKTSQNGVAGVMTVTELVTYIDGVESYTTTLSEKQTKAPVNKIILVGTKTYTAASSGFGWPTRGAYSISSYYGYRNPSISGWSFHGGLDIVVGGSSSAGIPVVAAASGVVEVAYSGYSGYGHTVTINHGDGIKTRYAHMYPGSITVKAGQYVSKGQQIGRIGSTGNSTGPHLHFEVLVNGSKVNPLKYIG